MTQKGDTSAQHKKAQQAFCTTKNPLKRQAGGLGVKWGTNAPQKQGDIMVYFCVLTLV